MRIGFDVSQTGTRKTGCGITADSLLLALAEIDGDNEYLLYPTFGDSFWDHQGPEATRRIDHPRFVHGPVQPSPEAARHFWRQSPDDLESRLGRPDVVHSHNFFCPTGLRRSRLVYTLYDLAFLSHPQWTTESNRQACFDGVFGASLAADLVLSISEHSRREFLRFFPHYPPERTAVMHLASRFSEPAPERRPAGLESLEPGEFLLFVGTLEPRKNPLRLLRAHRRYAARSSRPRPLVLAGDRGWLMEGLDDELAAVEPPARVVPVGYVDEVALRWLYGNCWAFVFPSLLEGFGLPVLEAMSLGAAVITSNVGPIQEVVEDGALLVDPDDERQLLRALERLDRDPTAHSRLRAAARRQAARFSWRRAGETVLACYEKVVDREKYAPVATTQT